MKPEYITKLHVENIGPFDNLNVEFSPDVTAIAELKAYKTYNQLSFHTPRVLQALKFVKSYEVKE